MGGVKRSFHIHLQKPTAVTFKSYNSSELMLDGAFYSHDSLQLEKDVSAFVDWSKVAVCPQLLRFLVHPQAKPEE